MTTYYAQAEGDEFNGRRYSIGEEIDKNLDVGTMAYLVSTGAISATKPQTGRDPIDKGDDLPDDSDPRTMRLKVLHEKNPAEMTREELVDHVLDLSAARMGEASDDDLRDAILQSRRAPDEDEGRSDDQGGQPETTTAPAADTGGDAAKPKAKRGAA